MSTRVINSKRGTSVKKEEVKVTIASTDTVDPDKKEKPSKKS